ncbi:hypothetical protein [Asticcacaulis sp. AND118]|uniref:hypothetical protein n=1 Tax=Asticcacaulis sp. AND118 TaxID=2840468 RepID=UPI001D0008D8|nr:hypothetical protein [Asticcacaulis sp. AND118]UDF05220.1 hypothetical protein LH365_17675 [Asticcacaulis sp. AND118]
MRRDRRFPPIWRVLLAFLAAPFVVAAGFGWMYPFDGQSPSNAAVAFKSAAIYLYAVLYPLMFFVGLPSYLTLRHFVKATPSYSASIGVISTLIPWVAIEMLFGPFKDEANGVAVHSSGARTAAGWLDFLVLGGWIVALGALAGLVFWVVAIAGHKSPEALVSG